MSVFGVILVCIFSTFSCIRIFPHSDLHPHFPTYSYLSVFSPNAGKCGKNTDKNNSEYGHFLRSVVLFEKYILCFFRLVKPFAIYSEIVISSTMVSNLFVSIELCMTSRKTLKISRKQSFAQILALLAGA